MDEDSETEKSPSLTELFKRPDGQPMYFLMNHNSSNNVLILKKIRKLVEKGGGVLLRKQISAHKDHLLRLVTEGEQIISGQHDFFDANYVINCAARRCLLPDLTSYRVNRVSVYQAYNPVDVLTGKLKWDDILKADCGEKVSDIEDDVSEEDMTLGKRQVKLKGGRMPYCRREREEIVEWIVKNGVFKDLRGNRVWARMELEMGGRSQQSLKEHFRKVIMPQIHTFKLSEENLDNFRVGMGLKQDDLVGARIALMSKESPRKKKKSKVDSPKKKIDNALKNLDVDESPESIVEPSVDDVQTTSQTSVSVSSLHNIQRSPKKDFALKKCFGPHARARIDLDTLLEQSDIDLSDKDSTATEPFNEDGVAAAESLAPERKKVKLFRVSEQFMNTPADPDTPAFGQRRPRGGRKRNLNIAGPPASSLQFNEGLREAGRGLSEDTEEDNAGLTSTQNLTVDEVIDRDAIFNTDEEEDVENEVFVNTSPTRKSLSPRKEPEDPSEKLTSEVRVNVRNHRLSDEEIVECREVIMRPRAASSPRKHPLDTEDQPGPSGVQRKFSVAGPSSSMQQIKEHERLLADSSAALLKPEESDSSSETLNISKGNRTEHLEEVGNRMGILEEMMRKSRESSKNKKSGVKIKPKDNESNIKENQSQNLLERHLNDHEKYNAKGGPETQDIVDALNNVDNDCNKEEDNDDEISFRTLSNVSPVRRKRTPKKTEQLQDDKWETSTYKSGRFFNEGEWGSTFRIPFSRAEEKAILDFFLEEGGFQMRKGVSVWKRMEAKKICHLRTWQAMKARWEKFIYKKLATYDVTEESLVEADMRIYGTTRDGQVGQPANQEDDVQSMRGRNGKTPYSRDEDLKIINHLLSNRRYLDVKGKEMWWVMEQYNVVPGRTWQSLKERFLKIIRKRLRGDPRHYGFEPEVAQKLLY